MEDYPFEYYQFFIKFNEGDYYTCHDLLEEIWMTDKGNLFLKGLLQLSVAIYHYEYGNVKGARSMMDAAYTYLQDYRPRYWGLNLELILEYILTCKKLIPEEIDRIPYEEINSLPKLPLLFLYLEDD